MVKTIGAVKPRSIKVAIGTGILFLLILFLAFGSWFQVDQGERGVVLRNGKLVRVSEPGLDFKTPFIDNVMTVSLRPAAGAPAGVRHVPCAARACC
ncbi:hypothetical protein G6F31_021379 [Rhizopus arrhizus]|nr:hypothetical protein G6F31_021379 [Rhizopus arrhizus]